MPADRAPRHSGRQTTQEDDKPLQDALRCGDSDVQVVSQSRAPVVNARAPGPLIRKADGLDIVKKASSRKGRCLLLFSCELSLVPGGELGELTGMDCDSPVLYMSFPTGRLKFLGAVLHPKNKYMVLKMGSKHNVLCEHVFENMVVFYKVFWIGTKSENPGEAPMPIPDELQAPPDGETDADQGLDFGRGLGMDDDEESGQGSKAAAAVGTPEPTPTRQLRARTRGNAVRIVDSSEDGADSDAYSEHDDVIDGATSPSSRGDDAGEPASTDRAGTPTQAAGGPDAGKASAGSRGASKGARKGRTVTGNGAATPPVTPPKQQRGKRGAPGSGTPPDDSAQAAEGASPPKRAKSGNSARAAARSSNPARPSSTRPQTTSTRRAPRPATTPAATPKGRSAAGRRGAGGAAAKTRTPPERRTPRRAAARGSYAEVPASGSDAGSDDSGGDGTREGSDDAASE